MWGGATGMHFLNMTLKIKKCMSVIRDSRFSIGISPVLQVDLSITSKQVSLSLYTL